MLSIYGHKWASHLGTAVDKGGVITDAAKTWQQGLVGVSLENIKTAFDELILKNHDWPPSLPEFRALCLSNEVAGIPTLDEVVATLVMVSNRRGSLASRYGHPLVFAVVQHESMDMFAIRTAKTVDAKRMIKPVYEQLLKTGWEEWPVHAYENPEKNQKTLEHKKPRDKAVGVSAFSAIRAVL